MELTLHLVRSIVSPLRRRHWMGGIVLSIALFFNSYSPRCAAQEKTPAMVDQPEKEMFAFRAKARTYFKASDFRGLESMVAEIRSGPPLFANGSWRLAQFYVALDPSRKDADNVWQQHEVTLEAWEKAFPESNTARIAHARFLISYAWQARGAGFANTVTEAGWKLFGERLNAAEKILAEAREMPPRDPMWWREELTLALGQGWSRTQEASVFAEAKKNFPQFYLYDTGHAYYLLPRWYGEEGDWEKSAEEEMQKPEGLGAEGYARVVFHLMDYYGNIFRESHASWPKTREGFEQMRKKYPASLYDLTMFYRLACLAGDRELAQELFKELNGYVVPGTPPDLYQLFKNWTLTGQPSEGVSLLKHR
jgi:hypothetical protein